MKLGSFHSSGVVRAAIMICSGLALLGLCDTMAQTPSQSQSQTQTQTQTQTQSQTQPQAGSASSPATPADDAAAKAAERKRRFDEQRKLLESGIVPPKEQRLRSDPDLVLSPIEV